MMLDYLVYYKQDTAMMLESRINSFVTLTPTCSLVMDTDTVKPWGSWKIRYVDKFILVLLVHKILFNRWIR